MSSSAMVCLSAVAVTLSAQFGLVAALTPAVTREAKVDRGEPLRNAYFAAEMTEEAPGSDWATKLARDLKFDDKLQAQLEAHILSLQNLRQQAMNPPTTTAIPITTTERALLAKINDLHREMCADPRRRGNRACAKFEIALTTTQKPAMLHELLGDKHRHTMWLSGLDVSRAKLEARKRFTEQRRQRHTAKARKEKLAAKVAEFERSIAEIKAKRAEWERDLAARATALGQELCDAPHRRSYAACQQFLAGSVTRRLYVEEQQTVQPLKQNSDQATATLVQEGSYHDSWVLGLIFASLCAVSLTVGFLSRQRKVVEQLASKPLLRC